MGDTTYVLCVGTTPESLSGGEEYAIDSVERPNEAYPMFETTDVDCVIASTTVDWQQLHETLTGRFGYVPFLLYGEATADILASVRESAIDGFLPEGASPAYLTARIEDAVSSGRQHDTVLSRTDARFRAVTESIGAGILTMDTDSVVQFANTGMESLLGYEPGTLEGDSVTQIIPDRLADERFDTIEMYLQSDADATHWSGLQVPLVHADGHEVTVAISFGEFEHDGRRYYSAILTEQPEPLEIEQLQQRLADARERLLREEPAIEDAVGDIETAIDTLQDRETQ